MNETKTCIQFVLDNDLKTPSNLQTRLIATKVDIALDVIFMIASTLGNGMVIVAILKSQNLQTPSYLLITSLAFVDLLVGLVFVPLQIAWSVYYLQDNPEGICGIASGFAYLIAFLGSTSLLMVTCISIDRYLALTLRHRYTIIVTKKRVRLLIIGVWIWSFAIAFLTRLEHLYDTFLLFGSISAFPLLSITCICYIKSFRALHLYTVQVHAQQANPLAGNFDVVRYKKTLKTMLVVLVCLLLCYVPAVCSFAALNLLGGGEIIQLFFSLSITFSGLHSSINPIIYIVRLRDIRLACREALKNYSCW